MELESSDRDLTMKIMRKQLTLERIRIVYGQTMQADKVSSQIYNGDPRPRILSSVMGSKMCPRSLRVFIFTLKPQYMQMTHAPDEPWLF